MNLYAQFYENHLGVMNPTMIKNSKVEMNPHQLNQTIKLVLQI
jgi:hypothetical protein